MFMKPKLAFESGSKVFEFVKCVRIRIKRFRN
jgi:hypothetical protein